jgi:thiol-disulfide isomerase/thioredoxin
MCVARLNRVECSRLRSPASRARPGTAALLALALVLPAAAQSRPSGPASQPRSRDEALWQEILSLSRAVADTRPHAADVEAALRPRRRLLESTRVYSTSYPGGPRRDQVVRLELKTLFEIGALAGGDFEPLRAQVQGYLARPPSEAALHEAAYWKIRCDRLAGAAAASQPASAPITSDDASLLAAYRDHIARYPRSRYVPQMATELFDAAARAGQLEEQRRLVGLLAEEFEEHAVTRLLTAQLDRQQAVGTPFSLAFQTAAGEAVDTADWRGRPVLIVVWAGFCERCRGLLPEVEALRAAHPRLAVVGVNLDESVRQMDAACRELGVDWPQFNDALGWANRFARRWGVRRIPLVFAVDSAGRLVGFGGAGTWRDLAEAVLEN